MNFAHYKIHTAAQDIAEIQLHRSECGFPYMLFVSNQEPISKRFGAPHLAKLFKKSKLDEFAFLKDAKKLETIVFILFLIWGTPKDMLTYVVGTSQMELTQFLVISTFARIPYGFSSSCAPPLILRPILLKNAIFFS